MANPHDLEAVENARKRIVAVASAALTGEITFIEASRELWRLGEAAALDPDPDLDVFAGIDSETDALPMGRERMNWAAEALSREAPHIAAAEARARAVGEEAAKRLVHRLGMAAN